MDISKLSITEIKAIGYDLVAQLEQVQSNLRVVNAEIAKRGEIKEEVKSDKSKK